MIQFERIHHVTLIVRDTERAKKFYSEILGLKEIERPPFSFKGAWFAVGDSGQQIHLIENVGDEHSGQDRITTTDRHFAIWVGNYKETIEYLEKCGIAYETRPNSITGFSQIYIHDPDNNMIELDAEQM
jgi:catechol 2,3-dioxygenase-like lactoylglutathione lyase family enzyme